MNYLDDRVVMITGASGGFGSLLANGCLDRGARVVALDLDEAQLQAVLPSSARCLSIAADVTRLGDLQAATAAAVKKFGQIDIMVNNAGIMPLAFYRDHEAAGPAWDRCIDVNIKGVLNGIIAVHDLMMDQGRGHVVNLSSIYGNSAVAGSAVYGATKAAVNMLSESLRLESQGKIKVTVVRPTGPTWVKGSSILRRYAAFLERNTTAIWPQWAILLRALAIKSWVRATACLMRRLTLPGWFGKSCTP
jgi:NADP-dependent 3-hydroxy acid dehydrogenase YdfG